jgi:hypothetical protein
MHEFSCQNAPARGRASLHFIAARIRQESKISTSTRQSRVVRRRQSAFDPAIGNMPLLDRPLLALFPEKIPN